MAELEPKIQAFNSVAEDRAMARARAVDAGEVGGVLAGVPIALKDNLCTTLRDDDLLVEDAGEFPLRLTMRRWCKSWKRRAR